LSVGAAFAGLVVLSACAYAVFVAVQRLGHELDRTRRRLEPKRAALQNELQTLQTTRDSHNPPDGVRSS
jgi:hypothetical protein